MEGREDKGRPRWLKRSPGHGGHKSLKDHMPRIPRSDHFDGNRFFNPTLPKGFAVSLRSALRMAREPRSRWPAWVENKGVHRLNERRAVDEVAVTFVNHATFVIQTGGITILTDPVWSERTSPL